MSSPSLITVNIIYAPSRPFFSFTRFYTIATIELLLLGLGTTQGQVSIWWSRQSGYREQNWLTLLTVHKYTVHIERESWTRPFKVTNYISSKRIILHKSMSKGIVLSYFFSSTFQGKTNSSIQKDSACWYNDKKDFKWHTRFWVNGWKLLSQQQDDAIITIQNSNHFFLGTQSYCYFPRPKLLNKLIISLIQLQRPQF